jgi:hypothetical protein
MQLSAKLLLLTSLFVFLSTVAIAQWAQTNGPCGSDVLSLIFSVSNQNDTSIFAGTSNGVYRSTNGGTIWSGVNTGLSSVFERGLRLNTLVVSGTTIFAGGSGGYMGTYDGCVYASTNNGASWVAADSGMQNIAVNVLATSGTDLFAATWGGLFVSTNNGISWARSVALTNPIVTAFHVSNSNLYAGTIDSGVFRSTDNGQSWIQASDGLTDFTVTSFATRGANLFVSTWDGVFLSTNAGANWTPASIGLPTNFVYAFAVSESIIYAGTEWFGVFRSTDDGTSWFPANTGLWQAVVNSIIVSGPNLIAGTNGGTYRSSNGGSTWGVASEGMRDAHIGTLISFGPYLIAGRLGAVSGVYVSSDQGEHWSPGSDTVGANSLAVLGTSIIAAGSGVVYRSTDVGMSWTTSSSGLPLLNVLSVLDTNIFVGTEGLGVFRSTDRGSTWSPTGITYGSIRALVSSGTEIFAGEWGSGVYRSIDNGATWTAANAGLPQRGYVSSLCTHGTEILAAVEDGNNGSWGVYRSIDNGNNWTVKNAGLSLSPIQILFNAGTNLFAGTGDGLLLWSPGDTAWSRADTGLEGVGVMSFAVIGDTIFAGTASGVWSRLLSEMITSVEPRPRELLSQHYSLDQNYPNPFNPVTTIHYALPKSGQVSVKVYNLLGQEVGTLVNEIQEAGFKSVEFDASQVTSGVYFYRIAAGEFTQTRKMILMK